MGPTFSLVISHTPWRPERVQALDEMLLPSLGVVLGRGLNGRLSTRSPCPVFLNDKDYRGRDWQDAKVEWALEQWRWSVKQDVTHHVFMTDDLHIAPCFWKILTAMCAAQPKACIGLLSNHPKGPSLEGSPTWYRTNSWIVGPCYVLPHEHLVAFLAWFEALPPGREPGQQGYANDDSSINEWISKSGPGEAWHPVPTPIEHRHDIESTVGHGDRYSRERLSWRHKRRIVETPEGFQWSSTRLSDADERHVLALMMLEACWRVGKLKDGGTLGTLEDDAPMLRVGEDT